MTIKQQRQLTRAEAIAARDELTARKGIARDGRPVYAVLSRSASAEAAYPVYRLVTVNGSRLVCDCPASAHGRICAHRAAVRAAIKAERDTAEVTAEAELRQRREASCTRPWTDDKPFSLFKQSDPPRGSVARSREVM